MNRSPETQLQTDSIFVRKMYLDPFEQGDLHYHSEVAEHIVCIVGEICISVQDSDTSLLPGKAFSISPFQMHQVRNRLGSPSQYLLIQYGGRYDFCASQT
jgi:quercetin dioxygenase-like cupin family protein